MLYLQERRRTRLFLRRDDYGRFMSCLVYLPRDRYTTQMRLRMEEILREAFDGASVDYTTRVSESVLARLHFVVGSRAGRRSRTSTPTALEDRLVAATRTWDEDFAESLRAERRRGGRRAAAGAVRQGVPGGLQGGLPGPRWRWPTCGTSTRLAPRPAGHEPR